MSTPADANPAPVDTTAPSAVPATPMPPADNDDVVTVPDAVKPTPAPPAKPPEQDARTATAFAKLAREQEKLRLDRAELRGAAAAAEKMRQIEAARDRGDGAEVLRLTGMTLDQIARSYQPPDEAEAAKNELVDFKKKTQAQLDAIAERDRQALIQKGYVDAAAEVEKNADTYPLVHETGRSGLVFEVMAQHFGKAQAAAGKGEHYEMPTFAECAAEIEADCEKEAEAFARGTARRAKVKGAAAGASSETQSSETETDERAKPSAQSPTISSRMNGEAATGQAEPFSLERHRRAVLKEFLGAQ